MHFIFLIFLKHFHFLCVYVNIYVYIYLFKYMIKSNFYLVSKIFIFTLQTFLASYTMLVKSNKTGTCLVVQWLRIPLPTQGTRVLSLVREDPTCHGATKPMRHNYWACTLEPTSHNYWTHVPQLLKSVRLDPVLRSKRSHRNEKPVHRNEE